MLTDEQREILDRVSRGQYMEEKHLEVVEKVFVNERSIDYSDDDACNSIVEASLYWTGDDEEKFPQLKRARTLAGYQLRKAAEDEHED